MELKTDNRLKTLSVRLIKSPGEWRSLEEPTSESHLVSVKKVSVCGDLKIPYCHLPLKARTAEQFEVFNVSCSAQRLIRLEDLTLIDVMVFM